MLAFLVRLALVAGASDGRVCSIWAHDASATHAPSRDIQMVNLGRAVSVNYPKYDDEILRLIIAGSVRQPPCIAALSLGGRPKRQRFEARPHRRAAVLCSAGTRRRLPPCEVRIHRRCHPG